MIKQAGLFDMERRYSKLLSLNKFLELLNKFVAWEEFRPLLESGIIRSNREKGGRPPYDLVFMFKVIVLQSLNNLSDEQTEYQILDRLSYMNFMGL
jgi:hypothetical protein